MSAHADCDTHISAHAYRFNAAGLACEQKSNKLSEFIMQHFIDVGYYMDGYLCTLPM